MSVNRSALLAVVRRARNAGLTVAEALDQFGRQTWLFRQRVRNYVRAFTGLARDANDKLVCVEVSDAELETDKLDTLAHLAAMGEAELTELLRVVNDGVEPEEWGKPT